MPIAPLDAFRGSSIGVTITGASSAAAAAWPVPTLSELALSTLAPLQAAVTARRHLRARAG